MDYRTRYLDTLRGRLVDRLPYAETARFNMVRACSDWDEHLPEDDDPLEVFSFDNIGVPLGYGQVPVDWYAVPRVEETGVPSTDGYVRRVDERYGRVSSFRPWLTCGDPRLAQRRSAGPGIPPE